jgi:hypothetical protein
MGTAAVGWSGSEYLLVTEYVGKKTSRALVFPIAATGDPLLIDAAVLEKTLNAELREVLRDSDHVFIEASSLEKNIIYFRTWGYGLHDKIGFRWRCESAEAIEQCALKFGIVGQRTSSETRSPSLAPRGL